MPASFDNGTNLETGGLSDVWWAICGQREFVLGGDESRRAARGGVPGGRRVRPGPRESFLFSERCPSQSPPSGPPRPARRAHSPGWRQRGAQLPARTGRGPREHAGQLGELSWPPSSRVARSAVYLGFNAGGFFAGSTAVAAIALVAALVGRQRRSSGIRWPA